MDLTSDESRGVLIFDGDCGFCTSAVDWLARVLPAFPPAVPYQWADLERYGLTVSDARERIWFVAATRQYGGHLAVAAILRHQQAPGLRVLGRLGTILPWSWLGAAAYALVARYRHRLPGGTPACRLTT